MIKTKNYNLYSLIKVSIICLLINPLIAQTFDDRGVLMAPKSPNTTMFNRFGTYEVNLFNGLPHISIPLFTIEQDDIKIPIELNYHASGVKVQDVASWVGLGWFLSTGGSLSRTVKGGLDESKILNGIADISSEVNPHTLSGYEFLRQHIPEGDQFFPGRDSRPDIFQYSLLGISGHFLYKKKNEPLFFPEKPFMVNHFGNPFGFIDGFTITNDEAIDFTFGYGGLGDVTFEDSWSGQQNSYHRNSWNLRKITSRKSNKSVIYNYHPKISISNVLFFNDFVRVTDRLSVRWSPSGAAPVSAGIFENSVQIAGVVTQNLLKEIVFSSGKLEFIISTTNRQDINSPNLSEIKIYNSVNGLYNLIKTIKFNYSYFSGNNNSKRLKLNSVTFEGIMVGPNLRTVTYAFLSRIWF